MPTSQRSQHNFILQHFFFLVLLLLQCVFILHFDLLVKKQKELNSYNRDYYFNWEICSFSGKVARSGNSLSCDVK